MMMSQLLNRLKKLESLPPLARDSLGPHQSNTQMKNETTLDGELRGKRGDTQALKTSAALTQVWKDELNSGRTLVSLFELFGEGILSFIKAPEMYMFL